MKIINYKITELARSKKKEATFYGLLPDR